MGSSLASVFLRTDNSEKVLEILKEKFDTKYEPKENDLAMLDFLKAFTMGNLKRVKDPAEREASKAFIENSIEEAKRSMRENVEPATVIVYERFVNVCWYDNIRTEIIDTEAERYSKLCEVPVLGVGQGAGAFTIWAVRGAGTPWEREHHGFYYFDEAYRDPADPEKVCEIIEAPFLLDAMREILSTEPFEQMGKLLEREKTGEDVEEEIEKLQESYEGMVELFEKKTGMPVRTWEELCRERGMKELFRWENAFVFDAR